MDGPEEVPMKFAVTAVAMSRRTCRRTGKSRVEIINTKVNDLFKKCTDPCVIMGKYEAFWNELNPESGEIVKVVDIREVK